MLIEEAWQSTRCRFGLLAYQVLFGCVSWRHWSIGSLIQRLVIRSLTRCFTLVHWLIESHFTNSLIHWFAESPNHWLVGWSTESLVHAITDSLLHSFNDSWAYRCHRLIDSIIHCFIDSLVHLFTRSVVRGFFHVTSLASQPPCAHSLMNLQQFITSASQKLSYRSLIFYNCFLFSKLPPRHGRGTIWYCLRRE